MTLCESFLDYFLLSEGVKLHTCDVCMLKETKQATAGQGRLANFDNSCLTYF